MFASNTGKPSHKETMHWLTEGGIRGWICIPSLGRGVEFVERGEGGGGGKYLVQYWSLAPDEYPLYEPIFY